MLTKQVTIINKLGLHARASASLSQLCCQFESEILVQNASSTNNEWINAKSIMALMLIAAGQGTLINLTIDGADEQQALTAITELINNYFGEGE